MSSETPAATTLSSRLVTLWHAVARGEATWLRYLFASVVALAADTGLFILLFHGGIAAMLASAIGYITGIAVHWLVSSRAVFVDSTAARGTGERNQQKAMFVASALVGLVLTIAIVGAGEAIGIDPRLAKIVAIVVSFQATYMLRRHVVFRG